MNAKQRKQIEALSATLCDVRSQLETLQSDEQEKYDNMPESLQGGDKGSNQEEVCGDMDSAVDSISEVIDALERATQ